MRKYIDTLKLPTHVSVGDAKEILTMLQGVGDAKWKEDEIIFCITEKDDWNLHEVLVNLFDEINSTYEMDYSLEKGRVSDA